MTLYIKQSDSQYKTQSELTNAQINITDRQLKDQISSGAPQIIVDETTLKDKNIKIDGMYAAFIEFMIRNTGIRNAYDVMVRFFAVSEDFKSIDPEIGYSGNKYFMGSGQVNGFFISHKFTEQFTSFYFCYEITYIDKLTGKKDGYTVFQVLQNNRGQDMFMNCRNQVSNKLRKLINSQLVINHQEILY
jgi:hypothetical protein